MSTTKNLSAQPVSRILVAATLAGALAWSSPLAADTIVRAQGDKRETLTGSIQKETWERVEILVDGNRVSVNTEEIYSAVRDDFTSALAQAQGEAAAAADEGAARAADKALTAAAERSRKPFEKEYAAWFRFRLWADRGNLAEARKVIDEIAQHNKESRFLPEAWIDLAQAAFGTGDAARIKEAGDKLKLMGTLGRAASVYFEALAQLAGGDEKGGGDRMRLAFRQLQSQRSVAGRRLLMSAAWH